MSDITTGIQQALNDIDRQALDGDWNTRFEVIQLLLSSISYIMSEVKKEKEPKQQTIKKTNYIPKYKNVLRYNNAVGPKSNSSISKGVSDAERLQQQKSRLQAKGSSKAATEPISAV